MERLGLVELTFSDHHLLDVGLQPLASHIGPGTALIVDEVRLPVRDRFGGAIQSRQQLGFVEVGVGVVGVRLQRDVESVESGLSLVQLRSDAAELRPGFEILRIQLDGDVKSFERSGEVAAAIQRLSQMEMSLWVCRFGHQRASQRFDGVSDAILFEEAAAAFEPVREVMG